MKEHERREYLKTLDEEKRQREESKFEEMKKKHGDHPKVHHPVRPQSLLTWSFRFQREKANKEKGVSTYSQHLPLLIDMGAVWEQCREHYKTHYIYPHFFYTSMIFAGRITIYKEDKTHEEETRMVFRTVGMPSWYAWPARNCITVPFALEKAN